MKYSFRFASEVSDFSTELKQHSQDNRSRWRVGIRGLDDTGSGWLEGVAGWLHRPYITLCQDRYTGKQGRTAKREERREQLHDGDRVTGNIMESWDLLRDIFKHAGKVSAILTVSRVVAKRAFSK
ncbi:hypothetical protein T4E_1433 [Trichinella pseudospiralis]|uniref:Uncharacterized protein n=1 Tax=Trichinella pseudospiralis TaxID=6337 RepID=A0A0V0XTN6_TRIPS|nr:hypothetical protein T4E_1433 [Trichinella pseudospiralis]